MLLAYLISEMVAGLPSLLHVDDYVDHLTANLTPGILFSVICGVLILLVSTTLNRLGFRLKL